MQRPSHVQPGQRKARDLTLDRTYDSTAAGILQQYDLARERLGVLGKARESAAPIEEHAPEPGSHARLWYSGVRSAQLCVILWRGCIVVQARGRKLSFLGHSSAYVARTCLEATKLRNTRLNQNVRDSVRTLVRHPSRPYRPDEYSTLQVLYQHERVLKRYRKGLESEYAATISRAYVDARQAAVYRHHALEEMLREGAARAGATRSIAPAAWTKLNVDVAQLQDKCVEVDGQFYTLVSNPLTHNASIRERAAHGLSAAVQHWLDSPLNHLRHSALEAVHVIPDATGGVSVAAYFRRWCLTSPRWQAVRAAQPRFHRVLRRLLDTGIDRVTEHAPFATVKLEVQVQDVAERFGIRVEARYVELADEIPTMPSTMPVPTVLTADGV